MKIGLFILGLILHPALAMDLSGVRESRNIEDRRGQTVRWDLLDLDCQVYDNVCTVWVDVDDRSISIPIEVTHVDPRKAHVVIDQFPPVRPLSSRRVCQTLVAGSKMKNEATHSFGRRTTVSFTCEFEVEWGLVTLERIGEYVSGAFRSITALGHQDDVRSSGKETGTPARRGPTRREAAGR